MKLPVTAAILAAFYVTLMPQVAAADNSRADCEVRKDGEKWKGASGPCSYSQRQGYVSIRLRNGDFFELRPSNRAGEYRDQKGIRVTRSTEPNAHEYRWSGGKRVIVRWTAMPERPPHGGNQPGGGQYGRTPNNLRDLVGARSSQAMNEMWRRGYELRGDSSSGGSEYRAWRERSTGRCVMTRNADGRLLSAVYTPEADCRR
jgi:hypothetical protein